MNIEVPVPLSGVAGNLAADPGARVGGLRVAGQRLAEVGDQLATLDDRLAGEVEAVHAETARHIQNLDKAIEYLGQLRDDLIKSGDALIARLEAVRY